MLKLRLALCVCLVSFSTGVHAGNAFDDLAGFSIAELCGRKDMASLAQCDAYFAGLNAGLTALVLGRPFICFDDTRDPPRAAELRRRFMFYSDRARDQSLKDAASMSMVVLLGLVYPCTDR